MGGSWGVGRVVEQLDEQRAERKAVASEEEGWVGSGLTDLHLQHLWG